MNKHIEYTIEDYVNGNIPQIELMDEGVTIILTGNDSNGKYLIRRETKCNFTLQVGGEYEFFGKRIVRIEGNNINLIAKEDTIVIQHKDYKNIIIQLHNRSKMVGENINFPLEDGVHRNIIYVYDDSSFSIDNLFYQIKMMENSRGKISNVRNDITILGNSHLTINTTGKNKVVRYIRVSDQGKLSGIINDSTINVMANGNCRINITGICNINAYGSNEIIARGDITLDIYAILANNIRAYQSCIVQINLYTRMYIRDTISKYIINNIKIYGDSIIKTNEKIHDIMTIESWLEYYGVDNNIDEIIIYKAVSNEYKTQEGTVNETVWKPGTIVEMPKKQWNPETRECGEGKFHACAYPVDCLVFRNNIDDKFVAIKVKKEDMFLWNSYAINNKLTINYPQKISFRKGEVLYECDMDGKELKLRNKI